MTRCQDPATCQQKRRNPHSLRTFRRAVSLARDVLLHYQHRGRDIRLAHSRRSPRTPAMYESILLILGSSLISWLVVVALRDGAQTAAG